MDGSERRKLRYEECKGLLEIVCVREFGPQMTMIFEVGGKGNAIDKMGVLGRELFCFIFQRWNIEIY